MEHICPHDVEHDNIRKMDGYVRDAFDNHRSVCIECFKKHKDRRKKRFHSPHYSYAIAVFLDITDCGRLAYQDS